MDKEAWRATVHGVPKLQPMGSDMTEGLTLESWCHPPLIPLTCVCVCVCVCRCVYGFPQWLSSKESACDAGVTGGMCLIPGSERSFGGGHGNPLQYSCLENAMDGGAWWATVHGVAKSRTRLSDFTSLQHLSNCNLTGFARACTCAVLFPIQHF